MWSEKQDERSHGRWLLVLWRTLIHIPIPQLVALIRHRLKKQWQQWFPSSEARKIRKTFLREWPHTSRRPKESESSPPPLSAARIPAIQAAWQDFQQGRITILNRIESFPSENFWSLLDQGDLPLLVVETIHYQDFLADFSVLLLQDSLSTADREKVLHTIQSLVQTWRDKFPVGLRSPWTAFTAARRVNAWIRILHIISRIESKQAQTFQTCLCEALFDHGLFVEQNLERHLGGNHLLNNLCGLAQLVGFFEGPSSDRWLRILKTHLPAQLKKQILADGGHYELSPMYHCLVMADLLSAADSLRTVDPTWVEDHLHEPLNRMGTFLSAILHEDGDIPFFNDSVLGQAPNPVNIQAELRRIFGFPSGESGKAETPQVLTHSGFVRLKSRGLTVIIDQGRLGPDELMGHVHSDALSFEVSFKQQRVLVNRGVYEYTAGSRRQAARSIHSHNTPCVDGIEQAEIWSSFRVGRRHHLDEHFFIAVKDGWRAGGAWRLPGGVTIQRSIILTGQGRIEVWDSIQGKGFHSISIPFHWDPSLQVRLSSQSLMPVEKGFWEGWEVHGQDLNIFGKTYANLVCELQVESTTWWPGFYREEKIDRLAFRRDSVSLPLLVWTVFSPFPELLAETDQYWERQAARLLKDPAHRLKNFI